jgi:predicted cupin superfamily sugar epimerase
MVGGDAIHIDGLLSDAAKEVSSADDDGDLAAERVNIRDLLGYFVDEDGIDAKTRAGGQGFARELEENSLVHVRIKYRTGQNKDGHGQEGQRGQKAHQAEEGIMTADEVKELLGLAPHPREGGWFVRTYEAAARAEGGLLRTATAIYYLLEPETFSEMHRLSSDEIFHFYAGDAVEQLQLEPGSAGRRVVLGKDLAAGERPQIIVPAKLWQGARLVGGGKFGWALLGCTVSPGFEYEDYEEGTAAELCGLWPEWSELVRELCRS